MNEGTAVVEESLVSTDGGRYDVDVSRRERRAVYWEEEPTTVRRCSWFFKGSLETRYTPYGEDMAEKLEEEYQKTILLRSENELELWQWITNMEGDGFFPTMNGQSVASTVGVSSRK